jgi:hypothetical protein
VIEAIFLVLNHQSLSNGGINNLFQDGKQRIFDNNFDSVCCCYYAGITLLNRVEL